VYYPITYVRTPNLSISEDWPASGFHLVEQKWDHFTVRRDDVGPACPVKLAWTTRGVRGVGPEVTATPAIKRPPIVCTSFAQEREGVIAQSGAVALRGPRPQTVYYPIPFVSTPNLALDSSEDGDDAEEDGWELLEQQRDHFTIRRMGSPIELKWTAKGLQALSPTAPGTVVPVSHEQPAPPAPAPAKEPALPSRPIPVDSPGK
jgi:hypothetical protein